MFFNLVCVALCLSVASAAPQYYTSVAHAPVAYHAPVVSHVPVATIHHAPAVSTVHHVATPVVAKVAKLDEEYDPNPQYSFSYNVQDPTTGDQKEQSESRDGDTVQGSYSLIEPDGSRRTVEYTADAINGFNAVVKKEEGAAPAVPIVAKVAPVTTVHHAPLVAHAPVAYSHAPVAYSHAPVAYSHAPVAYAHAPVAYAHAPVAHAPAVVGTSFHAPYATYSYHK